MGRKFIITGINKLTGLRDQLSGPMDEDAARQRLDREINNRRYQRYKPYSRLRMEHYDAVQLTLQFTNDND